MNRKLLEIACFSVGNKDTFSYRVYPLVNNRRNVFRTIHSDAYKNDRDEWRIFRQLKERFDSQPDVLLMACSPAIRVRIRDIQFNQRLREIGVIK